MISTHCGAMMDRKTRDEGGRVDLVERCRHCGYSTTELRSKTGALLRWTNSIGKAIAERERIEREQQEAEAVT